MNEVLGVVFPPASKGPQIGGPLFFNGERELVKHNIM